MSLGSFVGTVCASMGLGLMLVNGLIMIFAPKTWFDLPPYIGLRGSFRRDKLASVQGRFTIRLLGFAMISVLATIVVNILKRSTSSISARTDISRTAYEAVCLAACVAVGGCGLVMLFRPKWWIDKYIRSRLTNSQSMELDRLQAVMKAAVRVLSLVLIGAAAYLALRCVASFS